MSRGMTTVGNIVLFVLLLFACTFVAGGPWLELLLGVSLANPATQAWSGLAGALLATWIMLRFIEKGDWSSVGLGSAAASPRLLGEGFVLGAVAIALPTLVLAATGWLRFSSAADGSWWGAAVEASWLLVPAALLEEVLVRGYVFAKMRRAWGAAIAVAFTSVAFGLLHLANEGATPLSLSLVTLAGVFLGLVVVATSSVWAAWTAHLAWNWTMAVLLHTSVSGIALATPDYRLVDAGPDWATGGAWGPEGGVGAGLGMLGGIGYLIARRRRRARQEQI